MLSRKNASVILSPTELTSSSSAASLASATAAARSRRYEDTPTQTSRLIKSWQNADDGTSEMIHSGRWNPRVFGAAAAGAWGRGAGAGSSCCFQNTSATASPAMSSAVSADATY